MKKLLVFLCIIVLSVTALTACWGGDDAENQGTGNADEKTVTSNLGDYNIVIDSCRLATDYNGDPIIIVKYLFTNNDDDATAFMYAVNAEAYQNDIGLNECYFAADSANYSSDAQTQKIKKGATLTVEVAYELNDEVTDVVVEVSEFISFSSKKITKTFKI